MLHPPYYSRIRRDSGHHRRILISAAVLGFLGFIPILLRLAGLMLWDYSYYSRKALNNQTRITRVPSERGTIYDCNMNVLACNESAEDVYLDPQELRQAKVDLHKLSRDLGKILDRDPQWILTQSQDLSKRYKQIGKKVSEEVSGKIREYICSNRILGVHLEPNAKRYYPYGSLASQVLGFTTDSGEGAEGLEAYYNSLLQGGAGKVITTKGNHEMDMPFSYENFLKARPGANLILTLDASVQTCLERELKTACLRYQVKNGAFGIVMKVKTGEILAMATLGGYDPNVYQQIEDPAQRERLEQLRMQYLAHEPGTDGYVLGKKAYEKALEQARLKQWRNRCISDGYEPGSTFKVMTMAAALDCGAITLDTPFHCAGSEQIPGRAQRLHCWRHQGHGAEKTPQALQNSCNIAFAHIALRLGGRSFYDYAAGFGIMEKTGIDLAGESKGVFFDKAVITDTEKWGTASLTSASFGQTFKLTPIQLVRGIAAVVNGGKLMEPYLVQQAEDERGNIVFSQEPTVIRQVISPQTSKTMCSLMESVVTEGTAKNAGVLGFQVGGKTGTSEKIDVFDENGQRVLDKIVSFVGVAPMDDPEYIVLAALDTPSRECGTYLSGGAMAAPTVGAILEKLLPYLGVHRSYTTEDPAAFQLPLKDMTGWPAEEARTYLEGLGLEACPIGKGDKVLGQIPGGNQSVAGNTQVILYLEEKPEKSMVKVPDFLCKHRQQAEDEAGLLGLKILAEGNREAAPHVKVISQSHRAGTQVPAGTVITLRFADTKAQE